MDLASAKPLCVQRRWSPFHVRATTDRCASLTLLLLLKPRLLRNRRAGGRSLVKAEAKMEEGTQTPPCPQFAAEGIAKRGG